MVLPGRHVAFPVDGYRAGGHMTKWTRCSMAGLLWLAATAAMATYHAFQIDEVYSNADGTVQYVVLHEAFGMDGQNLLMGHTLTSTHGSDVKTFSFPDDLPGSECGYYGCMASPTAGKRVLIATQGFAALGVLTPDYILPNHFIATDGATIGYAGVDQLTFGSLPTDGVTALFRNGFMGPNVATTFAGATASVRSSPPPLTGPDLDQHGLTGSWYQAATSGQGLEVEVYPDLTAPGTGLAQISWFTFDATIGGADHQRWYTLSGPVVSGQASANLTIYQNTGGNFNALPVTNAHAVGTATLSFDSCSSGSLTYTFTDGTSRTGTIPLTRLTQNMTCSTTSARPTNPDFAHSGNWYDATTSGQGVTVEVNPTSSILFFAWYTYAPAGAAAGAAGQRWYTGQATIAAGARAAPLQIYETTGGRFDAVTNPAPGTVAVGTGTLTFQSCASASLNYTFTAGSSSGMTGTIALSRIGPVPSGCVQ
jgi:hypothetical protein